MHAVLVKARIEAGREAEGEERLHSEVLPGVGQMPGIVAGYWLEPVNGEGFSVVLFEDEESASAAAAMVPNVPRPDFVSIDGAEVRRVVANL